MKAVTRGQVSEVFARVAQIDWSTVDGQVLQWFIDLPPKDAGRRLTTFFKSIGQSITIDRSSTFDTAGFLGVNWSVAEQDERSLVLTEIDLSKVDFETTLEKGEGSVAGGKRLGRLKDAGHIRLDAKVFQTLLVNPHLIPTSWRKTTSGNITRICFDGTIFRDSDGHRRVLCLYWNGEVWVRDCDFLDTGFPANCPSAVLKK